MKINKNNIATIIVPLAIGIVLCFYTFRVHKYSGLKDKVIRSDGIGYYAYLPAIFIYKDLSLGFLKNKDLIDSDAGSIVPYGEDKVVNKYSVGLAILQLPFFLLAYFLSFLFNQPIDGFNIIFHTCFLVANLVYFTVGLIFLGKLLNLFKVKLWLIVMTLILFSFGNSILHYIVYDAYLSHSFSLSLMIILVYYIFKFQENQKKGYLIGIGWIFGLIVLLRPVNLLAILFFPSLFTNSKELLLSLRLFINNIAFVLIPFVLTIAIQLLIWYVQTGDFLVYSYGGEKFIWGSHDLMFAFLGYRRGFYVYNPIWLLFICYYVYRIRDIAFSLAWLIVAFILLGLVLSSWHNTLYGMCLGYRAMLEYQIFLLIPVLHLFKVGLRYKWATMATYSVLIAFSVCYSVIIAMQYRQCIIPWVGPNAKQYWEVFGKTDDRYNYHFFYPQQQKDTDSDTIQFSINRNDIFSDTGFTIYPQLPDGSVLTGVGFYANVVAERPHFASGTFCFFIGDSLCAWKHKLISKDVKIQGATQPYFIDDFIKDSLINKINFRFINVNRKGLLKTTNEKMVIYYKTNVNN